MKTGRVRQKDQPTPEETTPQEEKAAPKAPVTKPPSKPKRPKPSPSKATPAPARTAPKRPKPPYLILGIMAAIFVCFIIFVIIMTLRGGADEWVEATRVNGAWTTTVTILGPQVQVTEMWETDCTNNPNATVQVSTCIAKDANTYQDKVVDDYEEYAYNIYYEETTDQTYQAQGTEFTTTSLGKDDWWEENLYYIREEELDKGSCEYTNYTVWIDDPQNKSQEIEVYLAECEVWDHIVVKERAYDQKLWCQCDVTTLAEIGQQSEQGTGLDVRWARPNVPPGGRTERAFKGQATFLGGDYTYTTTTDDLSTYQDYLTSQYYIGLKDDKPKTVSKNP